MKNIVLFSALMSSFFYLNCMNSTEGRQVLSDLSTNKPTRKKTPAKQNGQVVLMTFYISDKLPALEGKKK